MNLTNIQLRELETRAYLATMMAVEDLVKKGRFVEALCRAARDHGPHLIKEWWKRGYLTPDRLPELITEVWPMAEVPNQTLGTKFWLMLFKKAGFITDTPGLGLPSTELTVYRGCLPTKWRRMSWTTEFEQAKWFADHRNQRSADSQHRVHVSTIPPNHILARFNSGREGEVEVVVNPCGIKNPSVLWDG